MFSVLCTILKGWCSSVRSTGVLQSRMRAQFPLTGVNLYILTRGNSGRLESLAPFSPEADLATAPLS